MGKNKWINGLGAERCHKICRSEGTLLPQSEVFFMSGILSHPTTPHFPNLGYIQRGTNKKNWILSSFCVVGLRTSSLLNVLGDRRGGGLVKAGGGVLNSACPLAPSNMAPLIFYKGNFHFFVLFFWLRVFKNKKFLKVLKVFSHFIKMSWELEWRGCYSGIVKLSSRVFISICFSFLIFNFNSIPKNGEFI